MVKSLKSHPKGLYILFFSEMWERFSFYGMRALLVLFMTKEFLFSDERAYTVYGAYTALVYATPFFGGLLADRILGYRLAVITGGILMTIGHFLMAFEHPAFLEFLKGILPPLASLLDNHAIFYLALTTLILGNGFFKPNISTIVGALYDKNDPRKDSAFTIFYMGINLGAFLAPLVCGTVGELYGWHWGFTLAGIGMVFGLVVFVLGQKHLEGKADLKVSPDQEKTISFARKMVYLGIIFAVILVWFLVQSYIYGTLLTVIGVLVLAYIIYYTLTHFDSVDRQRVTVALILTFFSMVFWSFFEQAGSSINLFTDRNVDRTVFGFTIPTSSFQAVNPLFILILAPIFSWLWNYLEARDIDPPTPVKFALGLTQLGLGFGALFMGAYLYKETGVVPLIWLILGYFLHTTGELCLSPVGLSMITKLSPQQIVGMMMGTWFLATAFSQHIASVIAKFTGIEEGGAAAEGSLNPVDTVMVYGEVFGWIALSAIFFGIVAFVISPVLRKWMHGIH